MQAQRYASTKMDYLVYNGYNNLAEQPKKFISDSTFKDAVALGSVSVDDNGISRRTVTVSVYSEDEAQPRARIQQVFYSNDATNYVTNGSSVTSSISMHYDKDNDRLYAMVDGQEKALGNNSGVPVGTVITWASNSAPNENGVWLECNGQSCADYPKLVVVLGKSTVPDYRGRFLETDLIAGTVKEAGLPNIYGDCTRDMNEANGNYNKLESQWQASQDQSFLYSGAFSLIQGRGSIFNGGKTSVVYYVPAGFTFDASRCSSIYGNSTTVQLASITVRRFIKAASSRREF